jgi:hypothetical protein
MSRQSLREEKDKREAIEGIKRGLESMKNNVGTPAAEFFREFFAEKGIASERRRDGSAYWKRRSRQK